MEKEMLVVAKYNRRSKSKLLTNLWDLSNGSQKD